MKENIKTVKEQKEIMNLKKNKSLANRKPQVASRLIHTIMLCKFLPIQFITWLTRIPCYTRSTALF